MFFRAHCARRWRKVRSARTIPESLQLVGRKPQRSARGIQVWPKSEPFGATALEGHGQLDYGTSQNPPPKKTKEREHEKNSNAKKVCFLLVSHLCFPIFDPPQPRFPVLRFDGWHGATCHIGDKQPVQAPAFARMAAAVLHRDARCPSLASIYCEKAENFRWQQAWLRDGKAGSAQACDLSEFVYHQARLHLKDELELREEMPKQQPRPSWPSSARSNSTTTGATSSTLCTGKSHQAATEDLAGASFLGPVLAHLCPGCGGALRRDLPRAASRYWQECRSERVTPWS